jgi:hypothetical protein
MQQQSGKERRMSNRIPMAIDMQVFAYGMLVASGVTVDMSEHGLLARIVRDYSVDELDPGKHLDVMLQATAQRPVERWLPIMVVRKWEEGIAARMLGVESCAVI